MHKLFITNKKQKKPWSTLIITHLIAMVAENHAQFLQSCSRKGTIDRHLPFTEAFLEKRGIRTTRAKFTILHENFPLQMSSWKLWLLDEAEKLLLIVEYQKFNIPRRPYWLCRKKNCYILCRHTLTSFLSYG